MLKLGLNLGLGLGGRGGRRGKVLPITAKDSSGNKIKPVRHGDYWYWVFTQSGEATPNTAEVGKEIDIDFILVGGGGGAGTTRSGGGGGGELVHGSYTMAGIAYTIVVGGGGAINSNGGNSKIGEVITALGGGKGGGWRNNAGERGGSGGGAAHGNAPDAPPAVATGLSADDNPEGLISLVGDGATNVINWSTGGGGGAGGNGSNGYNPIGGAGVSVESIFGIDGNAIGISDYLAGGGAGSRYNLSLSYSGGIGGGGNGGEAATNGTPNTGGGAGGFRDATQTGKGVGGSGICVIRWKP